MERNYRIYRYTNILNGMMYDGSTCQKYQSMRSGPGGEKYIKMCRRFGEAILEFGWPNFKYEVLEDGLTKEEALEREKYWIEHDNCVWPNGYNLEAGSKNGHSVNDETKKRMSEKRKGVPLLYSTEWTDERKQKFSESRKGEKNPNYGNHHSEASKDLMRQKKQKSVRKYTLDMKLIAEYSSAMEASIQSHIPYSSVCQCAQGNREQTHGVVFRYVS